MISEGVAKSVSGQLLIDCGAVAVCGTTLYSLTGDMEKQQRHTFTRAWSLLCSTCAYSLQNIAAYIDRA